jgi:uncharacterized protein YjiS (DUF1127 family)
MSRHLVYAEPAIELADAVPAASLWSRLARAAALPFAALAEAIRLRREMAVLAHLSERELKDIGLPPEAVARLVATRRQFDPFHDGWR